ncbi:hypothetical protein [Bariatricus massiliensis]|uniref:Uncharacterized protein n=1 Tax=Bariatricus massiliensis TaxID=1745713 RepID=A0ABS8DFM5_9FIRM|nr:hypothetical protein [Bariatricus massiliensis]MCB7303118.1 hypothetical protein [Bariatricus massiliensis]MCB7374334.1 hypothetical protein [Bariatricus massiliensis]MCB7387004.1 hypothetical protein [Bariatricus massiliensis]MCB7411166.1 hypothetical protein [Bariatricus massiliensis]
MSILTGKQVLKPYIKKATGYIKSLLSSQHVEMNDGKTLQSAVDEINNNLNAMSYERLSIGKWLLKKYSDGSCEMRATFEYIDASTDYVQHIEMLPIQLIWKQNAFLNSTGQGGYAKNVSPYDNTSLMDRVNITYRNSSSNSIKSQIVVYVYGHWK